MFAWKRLKNMDLCKTKIYTKRILTLVIFLSWVPAVSGQYLRNPSLEGPVGDDPPPDYWQSDSSWADPDLMMSYNTPMNGDEYFPADGDIFCLFRARGEYYNETWHKPNTREYLYQELTKPLETFSCFEFTASLCTNSDYSVNDLQDPDVGFPLRFQLWGALNPGEQTKLLLESELIDNESWEEYTFTFSTGDTAWSYLFMTVMWDTNLVLPYTYNGMMLIDKLGLTKKLNNTPDTYDTLYYQGDNQTTLIASEGYSHRWDPDDLVSDPNADTVFLLSWVEDLSVKVADNNGCPFKNNFHLILNCDTLHPEWKNKVVQHYFKYEENIVLEASIGEYYDWQPKMNLNAYDIQAPYLTDYQSGFTVEVRDKYNCTFTESFEILLSCDTLFPKGSVTVLDTFVTAQSPVPLTPAYGDVTGPWEPTHHLDCINCQNNIALPVSSIDYQVSCIDQFGCPHIEIFKVEVELQIPNVITPNNDGYNDCFRVYGLPEGTKFSLYDKEGRLIYENVDYTQEDTCWPDASENNVRADTYWYVFEHPVQGKISSGFLLIKR